MKPSTKIWKAYIFWLVISTLPWVILAFSVNKSWPVQNIIRFISASGAITILSTLSFGVWIGIKKRWIHILWGALAETLVLAFCYDLLMTMPPESQPSADIVAGAGIAIYFLPTLVLVAALIGLGALIGVTPKLLAPIIRASRKIIAQLGK